MYMYVDSSYMYVCARVCMVCGRATELVVCLVGDINIAMCIVKE